MLTNLFAKKGNLTKDWGSGFQDATHREDYDPMELNDKSYKTMGIFPKVSKLPARRDKHPWIKRSRIPRPGKELNDVCAKRYRKGTGISSSSGSNTKKECYILLPADPTPIIDHIHKNGGIDQYFTPTFSEKLRTQFFLKNRQRLYKYKLMPSQNTTFSSNDDKASVVVPYQVFNVAVHIRRGDILHPDRWIDQNVFANVAKHICQTNTDKNESISTNIHVFSSGPNRDGDWSMMERLALPRRNDDNHQSGGGGQQQLQQSPICANVYFHFDELEFDSWTFFIAADALVISPSTFSYVPALIRHDNVYYPRKFWHPVLSSFTIFNDEDGTIMKKFNPWDFLRGFIPML